MLNWLTRYAFVSAELDIGPTGMLRESVLDVGCGPHGLSTAMPSAQFAGVDISFPSPVAPRMVAFRNEPGPLPFEDAAFDTVVCLDVLEHVPPEARESFVCELSRVAARRVLFACPSDEGAWIDDLLRGAFSERGLSVPGWLSEHDEHGLPTAADIARFCAAPEGFTARELTMTNGLLSTLGVIADVLPEFADHAAAEFSEQREAWLELFKAARFGSCQRKGYVIERRTPHAALVAADDLAGTVWSAVRCPVCSARIGEQRVCATCEYGPALDPSGAFDVRASSRASAPRGAGLVTPAAPPSAWDVSSTALLFTPASWAAPLDWLPVLSNYIAAVPADRDVALYLDGRSADLAPGVVQSIVQRACEYLAEGEAFAAVGLLQGTVDTPTDAVSIDSPSDLAERLGAGAAPLSDDPGAIEAHACWVKTLVDAIQAHVDRAVFDAVPRVALSGLPLVTVRIPTYGSTDPMIERAIPSVLAGPYQNIEVLVCSDGPQPHARAAVQSVGDSRVRYLELEQRPAYPSWPEAFWQTAGTFAVNRTLDEARGAFIAPLDHDDAFTYDHIPRLLQALHDTDSDFVYGRAMTEYPLGDWRLHGSAPLAYGEIIHATVMYSHRLSHMRYDPHAWLLEEPGDWNLWRRMRETGADINHIPEPVAVHFKERSSIDHRQRDQTRNTEVRASDILSTCARDLLTVASRRHGVRRASG